MSSGDFPADSAVIAGPILASTRAAHMRRSHFEFCRQSSPEETMMQRNLLSTLLLLAVAACGENEGTPLAPADADGGETLAATVTALPGRLVFVGLNGRAGWISSPSTRMGPAAPRL
jgi:hypothetical protein